MRYGPVDDRLHRPDREMEVPLQQRQTPHLAWQLDVERVRATNSHSPKVAWHLDHKTEQLHPGIISGKFPLNLVQFTGGTSTKPRTLPQAGGEKGLRSPVQRMLTLCIVNMHTLYGSCLLGTSMHRDSLPSNNSQMERYDYIPPGMISPELIAIFPDAQPTDPHPIPWPYLRKEVPHIWRSDTRNDTPYIIGNASVEEAVCLYSLARQFSGKRGLEIGSHFGWTGAHLLAAGLNMDFIDPEFSKSIRAQAVESAFNVLPNSPVYRLWAGSSPQIVAEVRAAKPDPWSFAFIDGNHDGDAPETDAKTVSQFLADDAIVVFHDLTSPFVERGLAFFRNNGFSVRLFNTMQILGVAWRGKVEILQHIADPNMSPISEEHLAKYL